MPHPPATDQDDPGGPGPQALSAARSPRAITIALTLFAVLLACDLGFKAWCFAHVPPEGVRVIPGVLSLRLTENEGAVFGVMQGRKLFFIAASLAAAVFIAWFFTQSKASERAVHIALALILAGAMGNLYDRITHGAVRDMLLLFPGVELPFGWRWSNGSDEVYPWIFNLADVYLLAGITVIMLRSLLTKPAASPAPADPSRT